MDCGTKMEVKRQGSGGRSEVRVYLHQSKREEGFEGPARVSRAHLAVGYWRPGEREWIPLRRKCGGETGREGQSREDTGGGEKKG